MIAGATACPSEAQMKPGKVSVKNAGSASEPEAFARRAP